MAKRRHVRFPAFERLSEEGQRIVLQGCNDNARQEDIRQALMAATGETIANGSLGRFVMHQRGRRREESEARAKAANLVTAMKEGNVDSFDLGGALLQQALLERQEDAPYMKIETALKLQKQYHELSLKERALTQKDEVIALGQQKISLMERELEVRKERLKAIATKAVEVSAAVKEAEDKVRSGRQLTLDDFNRIRDVYGLEQLTEVPRAA